eukprot:7118815-Prymnesium_polylepis.2
MSSMGSSASPARSRAAGRRVARKFAPRNSDSDELRDKESGEAPPSWSWLRARSGLGIPTAWPRHAEYMIFQQPFTS